MLENGIWIKKPECSLIERNYGLEQKFGIDDLYFYVYEDEYGKMNIIGEIFAQRLKNRICFCCICYDEDGDILFEEENLCFGGEYKTSTIDPRRFFNGHPFSFRFSKPNTPIARIKVIPIDHD
mgnify:CR=1 FL=1